MPRVVLRHRRVRLPMPALPLKCSERFRGACARQRRHEQLAARQNVPDGRWVGRGIVLFGCRPRRKLVLHRRARYRSNAPSTPRRSSSARRKYVADDASPIDASVRRSKNAHASLEQGPRRSTCSCRAPMLRTGAGSVAVVLSLGRHLGIASRLCVSINMSALSQCHSNLTPFPLASIEPVTALRHGAM